MESSFKTTEAVDDTKISVWYDNNTQSVTKNSATQSTSTNKPKFIENVFGAIPAIRFDSTASNYLSYNGAFLANVNYTIFVVEQRRSSKLHNYFMSGSNKHPNTNLVLGYRSSSVITQVHYYNDMDFTIANYSSPIPIIHTFWLSKTAGKKYWLQGGNAADKSNSSQTTALTSYNGASLGMSPNSNYYNGDIAEIIVFTRDLKDEERQAIEGYLSKKYNIAITG